MIKVFISYYHSDDQNIVYNIQKIIKKFKDIKDCSVKNNDIDESLSDETIRTKIRDNYLRDTTVTIVVVGKNTKKRKHVDWEIHSSMYDGLKNKRSGIIIIDTVNNDSASIPYDELKCYFPEATWTHLNTTEKRKKYNYFSEKLLLNICKDNVSIPIISYRKVINCPQLLEKAIFFVDKYRSQQKYDLRITMRARNTEK